jgi:hypothetical protein
VILADTALLDANVLHPMVLCDLLIRLALAGYYRPRAGVRTFWTRPCEAFIGADRISRSICCDVAWRRCVVCFQTRWSPATKVWRPKWCSSARIWIGGGSTRTAWRNLFSSRPFEEVGEAIGIRHNDVLVFDSEDMSRC